MESGQRSKDGQPLPPLQHVLGITSGVREEAGPKQMQDFMDDLTTVISGCAKQIHAWSRCWDWQHAPRRAFDLRESTFISLLDRCYDSDHEVRRRRKRHVFVK